MQILCLYYTIYPFLSGFWIPIRKWDSHQFVVYGSLRQRVDETIAFSGYARRKTRRRAALHQRSLQTIHLPSTRLRFI